MKRNHQGMTFKKALAPKTSLANKVQPSRAKPTRAKNANPRRHG